MIQRFHAIKFIASLDISLIEKKCKHSIKYFRNILNLSSIMKIRTSYQDWEMKCNKSIDRRIVFLNFGFRHKMKVGFGTDHHHGSRVITTIAKAKNDMGTARIHVLNKPHSDH